MLSYRVGVQHIEAVEDAVQSALMTALEAWTVGGLPDNPSAWVFRVAHNELIGELRQRTSRGRILEQRAREDAGTPGNGPEVFLAGEVRDNLLRMLFVCCDEDIPAESQLVVALKTLCGFSVREIALRLFTSEANVYKRHSRAHSRLRTLPSGSWDLSREQYSSRLPAVSKTLYLLFTEGYLSSNTEMPSRRELCNEAIRLATFLVEHPIGQTPETFALLALMHLHAARMTGRQDGSGGLLLLEEQNRALWDRQEIKGWIGLVGQIRSRRWLFPVPRGGRGRRGTLPCPIVSGNSLGQGGGVLRTTRADHTLRDAQTEPRGRGCRVERTRGGSHPTRGFGTTDLAGRLLSVGCCAGRFASALRKHPCGGTLSRCRVRIGSHSSSQGVVAAATPAWQPRLSQAHS